jgi:hypothetical protein
MLSLKNYIKDIKYKSSYFDVEDNVAENPFSLFFACVLVCLVFQLWVWSIIFVILIILNEIYQKYTKTKKANKTKAIEQNPKFIQIRLEKQLRQAALDYCSDYLKLERRIVNTVEQYSNLDSVEPENINVYRLMKREYDKMYKTQQTQQTQ